MARGGGGAAKAPGGGKVPAGGASAKSKGKGKSGGGNNDDVRREAPLQAIVFADSFNETFRPISLEMPKVLLPLANVPMLEYSLEFLASSGVKEVILFCTHHVEQIEAFVRERSQVAKRLDVQCVSSPSCLTAGDALREIDRQQLVTSNPFVLMSGDVVANVDLAAAIAEHKVRKKADSTCMMTSIFKEIQAHGASSVRPLADELVVGIDTATSQIVLYEDDPSKRSTRLATIFLEDHAQIALRSDLMDCYIDICSTEVLLKFAEDFDYQDLRNDFFHNEVQNYELGNKFFVHLITDAFAARVMDPRTYSGIAHALLQRWVFPLVPDANFLGVEDATYAYHRGMIYKEDDVVLSRTCSIGRESIVGSNTRCGDATLIQQTSIGRNCTIGANVTIRGSFVWSNVVIEDDCDITNAILCDNVIVKRGAVIEEGCVLSFGVVIGAGFRLAAFSKVTTAAPMEQEDEFASSDEEDEDEEEETTRTAAAATAVDATRTIEWAPCDVGVGGVGRLWTLDDDDIQVDSDDDSDAEEEDDDAKDDTTLSRQPKLSLAARRLNKLKTQLIGAADVVETQTHKWREWETLSLSDDEDDDLDDLDGLDGLLDVPFSQIVKENVMNGDAAGHAVDDVFMEIKSSKFAHNKTFADVLSAMLPGLLEVVPTVDVPAMTILGHVRSKFVKWTSIVQKCLVEHDDHVAVVYALESFSVDELHADVWRPLFRFLLQIAYDLEWVPEDVILEWHAERAAQDAQSDVRAALAQSQAVQEFVDWLQDDEEDDDDEDSDDEDGEDSDDE